MPCSPFEIVMLICFGLAWPFSIAKSYSSRQNGGKSIIFLYAALTGYMAGIVHKFMFNYDQVVFLYILNSLMVLIDILLHYRNRQLSIAPAPAAASAD